MDGRDAQMKKNGRKLQRRKIKIKNIYPRIWKKRNKITAVFSNSDVHILLPYVVFGKEIN